MITFIENWNFVLAMIIILLLTNPKGCKIVYFAEYHVKMQSCESPANIPGQILLLEANMNNRQRNKACLKDFRLF